MTATAEHSKPLRFAAAALRYALAEDWAKVARVMERLNSECAGPGICLALMAWIDQYVDHSTDGDGTGPMRKITPINADTGSTSAEGMPPHVAWAIRLVSARGALDHDAFQACLDELPDDGAEIGRHVQAVLRCVAQTINGLPRGYARMGRTS